MLAVDKHGGLKLPGRTRKACGIKASKLRAEGEPMAYLTRRYEPWEDDLLRGGLTLSESVKLTGRNRRSLANRRMFLQDAPCQ